VRRRHRLLRIELRCPSGKFLRFVSAGGRVTCVSEHQPLSIFWDSASLPARQPQPRQAASPAKAKLLVRRRSQRVLYREVAHLGVWVLVAPTRARVPDRLQAPATALATLRQEVGPRPEVAGPAEYFRVRTSATGLLASLTRTARRLIRGARPTVASPRALPGRHVPTLRPSAFGRIRRSARRTRATLAFSMCAIPTRAQDLRVTR
jgi:hypothetical protein